MAGGLAGGPPPEVTVAGPDAQAAARLGGVPSALSESCQHVLCGGTLRALWLICVVPAAGWPAGVLGSSVTSECGLEPRDACGALGGDGLDFGGLQKAETLHNTHAKTP